MAKVQVQCPRCLGIVEATPAPASGRFGTIDPHTATTTHTVKTSQAGVTVRTVTADCAGAGDFVAFPVEGEPPRRRRARR